MKMLKENKGLIISGIALVLLSYCFTALISIENYYKESMIEFIPYIFRLLIRLAISVGVFFLSYKYGKKFFLKYGWIFVPIGILMTIPCDAMGYIDIFGYGFEILPLTNTLAILGLATYFYKYSIKSVLHTVLFWTMSFIFLVATEREYLTLILFLMCGLFFVSTKKNRLVSKKSIWILNIIFYIVLALRTINITLMGIVELSNLFYDSGYMAFIARNVLQSIKLFGAAVDPWMIGGAVSDFKLLWIFGLFGIVAGVVVFIALSVFMFFACKKCFKFILTDATPILYTTASILLVRFILSTLANFGIVLNGLLAPIPILSDGLCGYIIIFGLIGMIVSKEKVDIHSKRYGFVGRLSNFTKREFNFDGVPCNSIEGVLQSFKCSDVVMQKQICSLYGIDAKNAGSEFDWKTTQTLFWNGEEYKRDSKEYAELLSSLYRSVYMWDKTFKTDIEDAEKYELDHSIGVSDKKETVLTKNEFISNLRSFIDEDKVVESSQFNAFFKGLIVSVSDYSYEPESSIEICNLNKEDEKKYMPDVDVITKMQYESVEKYCISYFSDINNPSDETQASINFLLTQINRLIHWDTNEYHIQARIYDDKIDVANGTTAEWFPIYKKIADDLTQSIFEEDKQHIAELWHKVYQ